MSATVPVARIHVACNIPPHGCVPASFQQDAAGVRKSRRGVMLLHARLRRSDTSNQNASDLLLRPHGAFSLSGHRDLAGRSRLLQRRAAARAVRSGPMPLMTGQREQRPDHACLATLSSLTPLGTCVERSGIKLFVSYRAAGPGVAEPESTPSTAVVMMSATSLSSQRSATCAHLYVRTVQLSLLCLRLLRQQRHWRIGRNHWGRENQRLCSTFRPRGDVDIHS